MIRLSDSHISHLAHLVIDAVRKGNLGDFPSEGRALTNCIGNGVAPRVVAGWQGERDDEPFQKVLRDPAMVDRETEAALRGESDEEIAEVGARVERERGGVVIGRG